MALKDTMIEAYAQAGMEVESIEKVTVNFLGQDRVALRTVSSVNGVAQYLLQVFDFHLLRAAMKKVDQDGVQVTDDCSAVEYLGMTVKLVEGDERNLKITTPMDLKIAEMLLEESE